MSFSIKLAIAIIVSLAEILLFPGGSPTNENRRKEGIPGVMVYAARQKGGIQRGTQRESLA